MLYQYLTGPRFHQRVQAIVEAFSAMAGRPTTRRRKNDNQTVGQSQEQIGNVMGATVGLYGDLQGIPGKTIQEIEGLELKSLEAGEESKGDEL